MSRRRSRRTARKLSSSAAVFRARPDWQALPAAQPGTSALVAAQPPPKNTAPPTISGTPQQGQTLTATTGSWTSNPSSYAYQWLDCDSGGNACAAIPTAGGGPYL